MLRRPYSEYEFYVKMDTVKGIDVGTTNLNRKAAMEFSIAITKCEIDKLRALFRECKFFSLILDESTDVYRLEQCIVYIRFSIRGKIYTKCLHIDCVVRPNAEQLTDCVISMLNNILEWIPPNPENVLSSEDFSKTSGESDESDPEQNQTGYDINDGNLNEGNDSESENGPRPETIEDVNENVEENESI